MPHLGTLFKPEMCPLGALGHQTLAGHIGDVLQNNIKVYRERAGMTQEGLASAIGTTRNMLVKLERGTRPLNSEWLEKLGEALEIPPFLIIAPEHVIPKVNELAQMLADAQQTLPAGLPYSEWPQAVAEGLHMRLRTLIGDRANASNRD